MRDEFRQSTKETLAKRVGFRCSNPNCRKPTSGPQVDPSKAINVGTAAHITAAASGGCRFDPSLTPNERRHIDNGIWLCQTCGKLIDSDCTRYSVELLKEWKTQAEKAALSEVNGSTLADDSGANLAISISPVSYSVVPSLKSDKRRLKVKIAITSQNSKASDEGAMNLTIAYPLTFGSSTQELFRFADFRSEIGLRLRGYGDHEIPHAQSMRIPWGRGRGTVIFPGEWHDFFDNPFSFDVPNMTTDFNPTYLFQVELFTLNSPQKTMLFALRHELANDDLEIFRINDGDVDKTRYYEITETFWATYHSALDKARDDRANQTPWRP